jgi:predicted transcriptional regulator
MSNIIIKDKKENILRIVACDNSISRTAKGMLMDLLFTDKEISVKVLTTMATDGQAKVTSALKELENKGYLKRERTRNNGKLSKYNYVLTTPNLKYNRSKDLFIESLEQDSPKQTIPCVENQNVENTNVEAYNITHKTPCVENHDVVITSENQCFLSYSSDYSSDINLSSDPDIDMIDNNISDYISNLSNHNQNHSYEIESKDLESIKEQLCYDDLVAETSENKDLIDMIINIVHESFANRAMWDRVSGRSVLAKDVKEKFAVLDKSDILYVIDCVKRSAKQIRSIKPYLRTSLYNAALTKRSRTLANKYSNGKAKRNMNDQTVTMPNSSLSIDKWYEMAEQFDPWKELSS